MGLKDRALWELQWHPGGGGKFRRVVLTRRGLRRLLFALGLFGVIILAILGALPLGLRGFFARFTVEAAQRENRALRTAQDALREQTFQLAALLFGRVQRARRMAWAVGVSPESWKDPCPLPPPRMAGDEAVIEWLAVIGPRLDTLGTELAAPHPELRCPLDALPAAPPVDRQRAVPVALFGWRVSPFTGKTMAQHGTTLAAPPGEPVIAPGAGRVLFAGGARERRANEWTRFGNVVVLDHGGGVLTVFGHLQDVAVRRGQTLTRAQRLGSVGQTGWTRVPALYYEVRWPFGSQSKPIDPGIVTFNLPVEDLEASLASPAGDLPDDFALLEHLQSGRDVAPRPVRNPTVGTHRGRPGTS